MNQEDQGTETKKVTADKPEEPPIQLESGPKPIIPILVILIPIVVIVLVVAIIWWHLFQGQPAINGPTPNGTVTQ